jgi:hypothetical protein
MFSVIQMIFFWIFFSTVFLDKGAQISLSFTHYRHYLIKSIFVKNRIADVFYAVGIEA